MINSRTTNIVGMFSQNDLGLGLEHLILCPFACFGDCLFGTGGAVHAVEGGQILLHNGNSCCN